MNFQVANPEASSVVNSEAILVVNPETPSVANPETNIVVIPEASLGPLYPVSTLPSVLRGEALSGLESILLSFRVAPIPCIPLSSSNDTQHFALSMPATRLNLLPPFISGIPPNYSWIPHKWAWALLSRIPCPPEPLFSSLQDPLSPWSPLQGPLDPNAKTLPSILVLRSQMLHLLSCCLLGISMTSYC